MLRTVQRCSKHINDFSHHLPNVGRLNNGSFGACPQEVLKVQDDFRKEWLGQPDALYFDIENGLDLRLQRVETSIANYLNVESDNISIVENATLLLRMHSQHCGVNAPSDLSALRANR